VKRIAIVAMLIALVIVGTGCLPKPAVIPVMPKEPVVESPTVAPVTTAGSIGIGNAKVWVGSNQGLFTGGGYYPGARAEYTIPIYNNYPQDVQVQLLFELPNNQDGEYVIAPEYVKKWVTFENDKPTIPANSMREVLVILQMPKTAEVFAPKWEFRVTVVPYGQGMVQSAVSQRWLVVMR